MLLRRQLYIYSLLACFVLAGLMSERAVESQTNLPPMGYLPLIAKGGPTTTLTATATSTATPTPTATAPASATPTATATPTTTGSPQAMTLFIGNFYLDQPNVTPRTFSVKAFVTRNGMAFDSALVVGTITRGITVIPIMLVAIGNGYYTACNVGIVTSGGSSSSVSLTATDGLGNTASAVNSNVSNLAFPECP